MRCFLHGGAAGRRRTVDAHPGAGWAAAGNGQHGGSGSQPSLCPCHRALSSGCQMLLFSATFEDSVWQFAERIIPDPNVIKLRKEELTLDNICQYYVLCGEQKDKYHALCNIYGGITIGQAIIFCQVTSRLPLPRLGFPAGGGRGQ